MNRYVVQYKTSAQITEDSWEVILKSLYVDDTTTIGEIREWAKNNMADGLTIHELETLKKENNE